jgi:thioredoxin-dependent peroxiredoxin
MATLPEQGQQLPGVDFITEGGERLAAGDPGGRKTVLYFYKDDTPGCTKEA